MRCSICAAALEHRRSPAARTVGPGGRVLGIDVAASLLRLARTRATRDGLGNVDFRRCDATRTELPGGSYDAVI
jgi:O-methyltransferase / aklanonic acid methyltransferase